jgi:ribosome-associated protein
MAKKKKEVSTKKKAGKPAGKSVKKASIKKTAVKKSVSAKKSLSSKKNTTVKKVASSAKASAAKAKKKIAPKKGTKKVAAAKASKKVAKKVAVKKTTSAKTSMAKAVKKTSSAKAKTAKGKGALKKATSAKATAAKAVKKSAAKKTAIKKVAPKKAAVKKVVAAKAATVNAPKKIEPTVKKDTTSAKASAVKVEKNNDAVQKTASHTPVKESETKKTAPAPTKSHGKLADAAVEGILELKGKNISVLDLRHIHNRVCDYFIICQADSNTQVNAIANSVEEVVKKLTGERPYRKEGFENAEWVLVDYVTVVIHIFQSHIRNFYNLESLWADAEITELAFD